MTTIQLNVPDELATHLTESAVDQGQFNLFFTAPPVPSQRIASSL